MKRYLIAFDDTDNEQTLGTGHVLERFLDSCACERTFITRHQLFVDKRVPYTSHNSAMCAEIHCDASLAELAALAGRFLERERAEGSDPGLCIADLQAVCDCDALVEWGLRAKAKVLSKQEAFDRARQCSVHLSEHGGDGQGVVGALAAVGLRLSGNDGRVRGRVPIDPGRISVRDLVAATGFDQVCDLDGSVLSADEIIEVAQRQAKAIYRDFKSTIPVVRDSNGFRTLDKDEVKAL